MEMVVINRGSSSVDKVPTTYRIRNNRRLPFNLMLFNIDGLQFHNFSTVLIDWKSLHQVSLLIPFHNYSLCPRTFYKSLKVMLRSPSNRDDSGMPCSYAGSS